MSGGILEAVPNVSEGRDPSALRAFGDAVEGAGALLLDLSADRDHHRAVLTFVGDPATAEAASLALAREAIERIDLRAHRGVHPRLGALDVLPFVPLFGMPMAKAIETAQRTGRRIAAELGVPVYLYGQASHPPGRELAGLRAGGLDQHAEGFSPDRIPDYLPGGGEEARPHPSAGISSVGARPLLLAWNVFVTGVGIDGLRGLASRLRERGGGFRGLRTLVFELEEAGMAQLSMNLEEVERNPPLPIFHAIEEAVRALGGTIAGTEVIGMLPDALLLPAAAERLGLRDPRPGRVLSAALAPHASFAPPAGDPRS